jgi:hypothetical protein
MEANDDVSGNLQANDTIVPLFGTKDDDFIFLGTAFFVGKHGLLATAAHVLRGFTHSKIGPMNSDAGLFDAVVVDQDDYRDLALLRVNSYVPKRVLWPAFDVPFYANQSLMTFEYGTTEVIGKRISLNPATRLGNMTRQFNMLDILGGAGELAMELSFPALRGASGAPVIKAGSSAVWGIIVANHSSELLPHQIERVIDSKNRLEETIRFMLPQAVAVNINHLKVMFNKHDL